MKKEIVSRVKYILSVIMSWDSKFKAKIILAIGFLFIGYLYALGHRYQTIQASEIESFSSNSSYDPFGFDDNLLNFDEPDKIERISVNYEYILDTWTGKLYQNYGLEFSKLHKKKEKDE